MLKRSLYMLLLCLVQVASLPAQVTSAVHDDRFDIRDASFLLPQPAPSGSYSSSLILCNVLIPKDWTLDLIKAPMLCYAGKLALPEGFSLHGGIFTLFVSNRLYLGPAWSYSAGHVHFGAGYQVGFNYGILNQFGFHTTLTGWEQQPNLTVGYSFNTMAVILRGDLYWTTALYLSEGDNTIPFTHSFINGYSISCSLEQRMWANRVVSFGLQWNYLRYHVLAWPAFPVNRYRYDVPEFRLGLNF
jgi:hypothetical protein